MKKIFTFLTTMVFIGVFFAQGSESFTNLNAPRNTYGDGSFTGDNGVVWTYGQGRKATGADAINTTSIGLKDTGTRFVKANSGVNGVGTLTYSVRSYFTGGTAANRTVEVWVNGTKLETYTLAAMATTYTRTVTANVAGNVLIEFKSTGTKHIVLDDISWTASSASPTPTLSSSPSSLSFGNVYTSTTSSASTVTVTGSDLTSAPTYNITGTDAAMFSASGTLTTSGGNLSVTFTPTSVGAKSATLTVTSGALSSTVTLSGTGLSADNPFGLVETSPVVALLEDFESGTVNSTTMPTDWKSANENTSDKNWTIKTYSSNKYAEMTAHNGTGTYNSWLISPAINLDKINKTNVQFDWNSGYANGALLKVYVLKLNNGVMSKNLIKTINDVTNSNGYGSAFTTETIDVSAYSGIGFLAFEYVGTAGSTTTTYQIDKVTISTSLGIKDLNKTKNIFLKNTMVDNTLSFQTKGNATVRVYNTNGQLVKTANVSAQNANVNVANLPKGNYVVTAELNGETVSQKILKK